MTTEGNGEVTEITIDVWSVLGVIGIIAAFVIGIGLGRIVIGQRRNQANPAGQPLSVQQNQVQQPSSAQSQTLQEGAAEPADRAPQTDAASDEGLTVSIDADSELVIGEAPPEFTLTDLGGNELQLSEFEGQPIVLNFWATWCAPCRIEMPVIEDAYQKYGQEEGLAVIGVNMQEPKRLVNNFVRGFDLTFPIVLDPKADVSRVYQVRALPTTVFINRDGIVTDIHRGMLTESSLQGYLDDILAEAEG